MLEPARAARAGRRVPAGGRTGNGPLGGLPRASNNRLRTESKLATGASARRLAPTHVRAFAPQGPVPLAQPARPTRRGGPPRSSLPNGRRAESFADDLKRDGALSPRPSPAPPRGLAVAGRHPTAPSSGWRCWLPGRPWFGRDAATTGYGWLPPARRPGRVAAPVGWPVARCVFQFLPRSVDLRSPSSQADPPRPARRDALDGSTVAATLAHELSWTRDCLEDPRYRAADSRRPCPIARAGILCLLR
uniref:Uncharacterized protein n=1 Tax=Zea mays TaxID=4577 RepID=A0A804PRH2_MAIZE